MKIREIESGEVEPNNKFDPCYQLWQDPDLLKEALEYMENYEEEAAAGAKEAKELGDEAIAAIERGDAEAALKAIDEADTLENHYGDSLSYGPALEAVRRWAEKEEWQ